ncbi:MAG TPA: DUF1918 domain-containing protein [Solirubrobacteraceae bacterium]|nr:DUF1918 domain-containing protein [Solirubrobacteraceae bacterium]
MADSHTKTRARAGDRVEVRRPDGSVRHGVIVEVLGEPTHLHFQVRWSASHESMVFPGDDVLVIPARPPAS